MSKTKQTPRYRYSRDGFTTHIIQNYPTLSGGLVFEHKGAKLLVRSTDEDALAQVFDVAVAKGIDVVQWENQDGVGRRVLELSGLTQ